MSVFISWVFFIHSFIHCRHLYSASSSGATQKRSKPGEPPKYANGTHS